MTSSEIWYGVIKWLGFIQMGLAFWFLYIAPDDAKAIGSGLLGLACVFWVALLSTIRESKARNVDMRPEDIKQIAKEILAQSRSNNETH